MAATRGESRISSYGGGGHLKKMRRGEGGAKMFVVFRVKNYDFMPKNHIFTNFRGRAGCAPPGSAPGNITNIVGSVLYSHEGTLAWSQHGTHSGVGVVLTRGKSCIAAT